MAALDRPRRPRPGGDDPGARGVGRRGRARLRRRRRVRRRRGVRPHRRLPRRLGRRVRRHRGSLPGAEAEDARLRRSRRASRRPRSRRGRRCSTTATSKPARRWSSTAPEAGSGRSAVQLARWAGAHVIGTGRAGAAERVLDARRRATSSTSSRTVGRTPSARSTSSTTSIGGEVLARSPAIVKPGGALVSIMAPPPADRDDIRTVHFVRDPNGSQLARDHAAGRRRHAAPASGRGLPARRGPRGVHGQVHPAHPGQGRAPALIRLRATLSDAQRRSHTHVDAAYRSGRFRSRSGASTPPSTSRSLPVTSRSRARQLEHRDRDVIGLADPTQRRPRAHLRSQADRW